MGRILRESREKQEDPPNAPNRAPHSGVRLGLVDVTPPSSASYARAAAIVRRLREAGHQALLAGGCVRDMVLGLDPKDYDITTSARPEAVEELFALERPAG